MLDLDSQPFDFWKQIHSTMTVVVFTRTDCPIANRAAPEVRRLHEKYHQKGVEFLLVYVDPREQAEAIRKHLNDYGYVCRALRDPHHSLVAHCRATKTPEAVIFATNGTILYQGRVDDLYVEVGQPRAAATFHDLDDALDAAINQRRVARPRTETVGCLISDLKN